MLLPPKVSESLSYHHLFSLTSNHIAPWKEADRISQNFPVESRTQNRWPACLKRTLDDRSRFLAAGCKFSFEFFISMRIKKAGFIKRGLLLGRKAMTNLDSILKSRDIILPTKVHLVKAIVSPVVTYGCESWTVKRAEHQRTDAFELRCWRKLLRVPWTCYRSNKGLVTEVVPESTFQKEVWARLKAYLKLPPNDMRIFKQIIRNKEKEKLHAVNVEESSVLRERWLSDKCMIAIVNFLSKKAKLWWPAWHS